MKSLRCAARGPLFALALAFVFAGLPIRAQDSPMFRNGPAHTGIYSGSVPLLHRIKWTFHAAGEFASSPAIAQGLVYIGCNDGSLYAIAEETGKQRWAFKTGSRIPSSPAVAAGLVYFSSYDGNFYAVDAAGGKLRWKFADPGERRFSAKHLHGSQPAGETMPDPFDVYLSSPVVWNGTVYFGSGDGNIYALDAATGALRWKFQTGDVVHASPAISDGRLFVGSWDSYFYALDAASGKELWRFKTGEDPDFHNQVGIQSSATVADGVVYFGCRDSNLYAVDAATGKLVWKFNNKGSWVVASPIVHEGKVYFATSDTALFRILDARSGAEQFTLPLRWLIFSSPAIAGSDIFIADQGGKLNAIDLGSNKIVWTFQNEKSKANLTAFSKPDGSPDYTIAYASDFYDDMYAGLRKLREVGPFLSSPVVSGNTLFIAGTDGNLDAIE